MLWAISFVERQTHLLWTIKVPNRIKKIYGPWFSTLRAFVKNVSVDHGQEFAGCQELQNKYHLSVYFINDY
ncbi:hypothetical protein [Fructobacillus tropaeoli]|uniref:hypothetical protein n=1 Tax=Fructobacillus tropaeoli TaxID=709323 RepID=UPI001944B33A|nr:hypothetical protein [Fructobacillus tropaeoli]GIC70880.1 hypothetical protein FT12353_15660 [Fructobacillus tropaeoli]